MRIVCATIEHEMWHDKSKFGLFFFSLHHIGMCNERQLIYAKLIEKIWVWAQLTAFLRVHNKFQTHNNNSWINHILYKYILITVKWGKCAQFHSIVASYFNYCSVHSDYDSICIRWQKRWSALEKKEKKRKFYQCDRVTKRIRTMQL